MMYLPTHRVSTGPSSTDEVIHDAVSNDGGGMMMMVEMVVVEVVLVVMGIRLTMLGLVESEVTMGVVL